MVPLIRTADEELLDPLTRRSVYSTKYYTRPRMREIGLESSLSRGAVVNGVMYRHSRCHWARCKEWSQAPFAAHLHGSQRRLKEAGMSMKNLMSARRGTSKDDHYREATGKSGSGYRRCCKWICYTVLEFDFGTIAALARRPQWALSQPCPTDPRYLSSLRCFVLRISLACHEQAKSVILQCFFSRRRQCDDASSAGGRQFTRCSIKMSG